MGMLAGGFYLQAGPTVSLAETLDLTLDDNYVAKIHVGHGFDSSADVGTEGACSPATVDGYTVKHCFDGKPFITGLYFGFLADSDLGQNFLYKLVVEDEGGSPSIELLAADATYQTDSSTYCHWTWTTTYWTGDWSDDVAQHKDVEVWLS